MENTDKNEIIRMLNTELRNQPVELCGILASTDLLILEILDRLEFPAVRSASIHTYLVCADKDMEFILNDFEALVELAKDTPTFFAKKLHCFLGKMVESLQSEKGGVAVLLQLASKLQEMRRSEKTDAVRAEVVGIYADLVLHALDYLRPDSSDDGEVVIGVTSNAEPITAENPFAYFSVAEWQCVLLSMYEDTPDLTPFVKRGIVPADCTNVPDAVNTIFRRRRVFTNLRCALLPYMDEFTYSLFPTNIAYNDGGALEGLVMRLDMDELDKRLAKGKKASLPLNGVTVTFDDPTKSLMTLQLKEVPVEDHVCVVYKLAFLNGEFAGYYIPGHDDCYYAGMDYVGPDDRFVVIKKLVMFFYAVAVLGDEEYTDESFEQVFLNLFYPVKATSDIGQGRLRDTVMRAKELGIGTDSRKQAGRRMFWKEPLRVVVKEELV